MPSPPYRWRFGPIVVTLIRRSCVARQEPYIPGALSILQGTVPGRVRGSGHMVPTYFRRELRDRALQRPSRLRTFVSVFAHTRHRPRKRAIQYPRVLAIDREAAAYWIPRFCGV